MLLTAIASEQAILTWRAGLTGGFVQTFKIIFRNLVSDENIVFDTSYNASLPGDFLTFLLTNLQPETVYKVRVVSMNKYNGGSETGSKEVTFITRGRI